VRQLAIDGDDFSENDYNCEVQGLRVVGADSLLGT
jgi:hypothetical protein